MAGIDSSSRTRVVFSLDAFDKITIDLGTAHAGVDALALLAATGDINSLSCLLLELEEQLAKVHAFIRAAARVERGGAHG